LSVSLQGRPRAAITPSSLKAKELDAEAVTALALNFLARIGHKSGVRPRRVTLEEGSFIVEVELRKLLAVIRVDAESREIKEYEIQRKGEEESFASISPKILAMMFGISAAAYVALRFVFQIIGL